MYVVFAVSVSLKGPPAGISVTVVGCVGETALYGTATATYAVDGAGYDATNNNNLASSFSVLSCNVTLFASPTLPFGQHTLEVTMDSAASNTLWIDYFQYDSANVSVPIQSSQ